MVLKARSKQWAATVYQNDILWAIAMGLGGKDAKIKRFTEIIKPVRHSSESGQDIVNRLKSGLKKLQKGGK